MEVHGYTLTKDWSMRGSAVHAMGTKDGKQFFLKKYQNPVMPIHNGTLSQKDFDRNMAEFDAFVRRHKSINATLRAISGPGGNLIVPVDEFVDELRFVEVTDLIEGAVPDKEVSSVLQGLPWEEKLLSMKTAAGALAAVHSRHIVHSDIKPQNFLIVRNSSGHYVAKLIDFDGSYFADQKPEELIGTQTFFSPELAAAKMSLDAPDYKTLLSRINEKSDIFSLGLLFHYYLTGVLPEPVRLTAELQRRKAAGRNIQCWFAMLEGCGLEVSARITDPACRSLIGDMLSFEPERRPSASETLIRLGGGAVTEKDLVIDESWPEDPIRFNKEILLKRGIISVSRQETSGVKGYSLRYKNGSSIFQQTPNLLAMGYAAAKGAKPAGKVKSEPVKSEPVRPASSPSVRPSGDSDAPWPEHSIVFDLERIQSRGYTRVERATMDDASGNPVKGYRLVKSDGSVHFLPHETMLQVKYARKAD